MRPSKNQCILGLLLVGTIQSFLFTSYILYERLYEMLSSFPAANTEGFLRRVAVYSNIWQHCYVENLI